MTELTLENVNELLEEFRNSIQSFTSKNSNITSVELKAVLDRILKDLQEKIKPKEPKPSFFQKIVAKLKPSGNKVPPLIEQIEQIAPDYSKLPRNVHVGMILDPLEGKDQDFVDFIVLKSGAVVLILCDGVSGEGPQSKIFAQKLIFYLKHYFHLHSSKDHQTISGWEDFVQKAIKYAINTMAIDGGASTLLLALLNSKKDRLFLSWVGDGHMIFFNQEMTGFAKFIFPQRDMSKKLTGAVTAQGLIGTPVSQVHSLTGGTLILASDGFDLTSGLVLNHFYKTVLRQDDISSGLHRWQNEDCCSNGRFHPSKIDDRSLIILRWGRE
jgi:hypothetical protein